ncbi:hypothetical protein CYANOKiyG1_68760 [Okeania sp. KiyG1]|nr:hypothetical protein CYANOKiyG1_68760 [Okeania sp. KiyG1]
MELLFKFPVKLTISLLSFTVPIIVVSEVILSSSESPVSLANSTDIYGAMVSKVNSNSTISEAKSLEPVP